MKDRPRKRLTARERRAHEWLMKQLARNVRDFQEKKPQRGTGKDSEHPTRTAPNAPHNS